MPLDAWITIVSRGTLPTDHGSRLFHVEQLKRIVTYGHGSRIINHAPRTTDRESLSSAWIHSSWLSDQIPSIVSRETMGKDHGSRITDHGSRITDHGSRENLGETRCTDHVPRLNFFVASSEIVRTYILLVVKITVFSL